MVNYDDDYYDEDGEPEPRPCPDCGGNPSEDECSRCGGDGWVED